MPFLNPFSRTERFYLRLILGLGVGFALLILLGWGSFQIYGRWQERQSVRRAAGYLSGGDLKAASLSARRALQLNQNSIEGTRMMAQIAERVGDATAVTLHRRVVELEPSFDSSLALVRSALRFNDLAIAEKALASLRESGQQRPEYHAASGRFAEMRKDRTAAEHHWKKAVELTPEDADYRRQLALLHLSDTDMSKREAARGVLRELRSDPKQRAAATRALITDGASRNEDAPVIRQMAKELQGWPDATFSDRLLYLEILHQMRDAEFDAHLAELKKVAPAQAIDLASLVSWMNINGRAAELVALLTGVPAEILSKWPVPLARAETYAKIADWPQLEQMTALSSWGAYDFLRRAYLTRAFRGQDKMVAANQEWAAAQKEASESHEALTMLTQSVSTWGWQQETTDLLWALAKLPETRAQALQTLYEQYAKTGDTGGLYRALARALEIEPGNVTMQNNFAQISLLLNADVDRAHKMALELAEKEPTNPSYVSTCAYAQYLKGNLPKALETMRQLTEAQLREPPIAAYHGILLAAAGEREKAAEFLGLSKGAFLLPEEKELIAKAEKSLR